MLCGDAVNSRGEAEKSELSALLSGPTMWLGAQDGRYGIQLTWQCAGFILSSYDGLWKYSTDRQCNI